MLHGVLESFACFVACLLACMQGSDQRVSLQGLLSFSCSLGVCAGGKEIQKFQKKGETLLLACRDERRYVADVERFQQMGREYWTGRDCLLRPPGLDPLSLSFIGLLLLLVSNHFVGWFG
jgi:hypothetical protein